MSKRRSFDDALALSPAERILLVEEIWDSIAAEPDAVKLTAAQRRELEARLRARRRERGVGAAWAVARRRITKHP